MEIDFNAQCEVPFERIRFYATYELEDIPSEPDVNWPGGKEILAAKYTIEIPSRHRHKRATLVTTSTTLAALWLRTVAKSLNDEEVEPFVEMTSAAIHAIEEEALESQ